MVIQKLQATFHLMEFIVFEKWKLASPEDREKITEKLGKLQGEMILKEIDREVSLKFNN